MAQDEARFTIIPLRLEKELSHGDHRLSIFQQYDLFSESYQTEETQQPTALAEFATHTPIAA